MHGHWDIKETEMNDPRYTRDHKRGVNLGIGVVVPSSKILETLNHPDLKGLMEENEGRIRRSTSPRPDKG
jgi:hypothetical protein